MADEPSSDQQLLIDEIATLFGERGRWPPYLFVDKHMEREHGIDLVETFVGFPGGLIWPEPRDGYSFSGYQAEIGLTAVGLAQSRTGAADFELYLAALRYLAEREQQFEPKSWDEPEQLQVGSDELTAALSTDELGLLKLHTLFRLEPHATKGSSGQPPGPWTIIVAREVRRYRGVETAAGYRAHRFRPHPADAAARAQEASRLALVAHEYGIEPAQSSASDPAKVFVVYGRNGAARRAMFDFLRSIGLEPMEWAELLDATGTAAPYIGEILERGFELAQAVVILLTPDDQGELRAQFRSETEPPWETELTPQARLNVVFEAGMAFASHPDRTVIVEVGQLRPFSDIAGRHTVHLNNSSERRQDLAHRLERAGCRVNLQGTDWHSTGDFEGAATAAAETSEPTDESSGGDEVADRGGTSDSRGDLRWMMTRQLTTSFTQFIDTFLWRRGQADMAGTISDDARKEYEELHRGLVRDYARVRDDYIRFAESDAAYDLRLHLDEESPHVHAVDEPLTSWWRALTLDDALERFASADDEHLSPFIERQKAVLRAFADSRRPSET